MPRVQDLIQSRSFYQMRAFQGSAETKLTYAKFGKGTGRKGSLIFVNGRMDNILLYIELFYDLYQQGWSPIYTYDHRGQGFSRPLIQNNRVGHVKDYSYYIKDFELFLSLILEDPEMDKKSLFAITHSLGGSIVVDFLQNKHQQKILKAVVLDAPLFRIRTGMSALTESVLLKLISLRCLVKCVSPLPFIKFFIKKDKKTPFLTSSLKRHQLAIFIEERFPHVSVGSPSYRWVLEIYKLTDRLMQKNRIQNIKTPLLILQGEKDRIVSLRHQKLFCSMLPEYCHIQILKGDHKVFIETDSIRDRAIQLTQDFFLSHL